MKKINREGFLRMIGMRDTAGFLSKINALFIDIYDEGGKLAEYSTQLIVTSKNITLLAQRVTDNEQDIANLTVTAQQISASVSSLQTTVSGHTEQIASLTITTNSITQSVSSLTTTVNGHTSQISTLRTDLNGISATVTADHTTLGTHTTQIGSLQVTTNSISQSVSNISDEVDAIDGTVTNHTSQISTLRTDLNGISATVTADHTTLGTHTTQIGSLQTTTSSISQSVSSLTTTVNGHTSQISTLRTDLNGISATVTADHTTLGTHTTQIGSLQTTTTSISGRVTAIEGDYVKEAEISLMVKKDSSGYISNASIKADNILFTFTKTTNFISGGQTVMSIDNGGNLRILGTLTAGCVIGNLNVDNSGNISGTGSVTTDNVVAGYKTQEITVPSTNNSVTDMYSANGLFVFLKGSTSANTHYFRLPTLSDIRSVLGITSSSKFFCTRMIVINQSSAGECYLTYRDGYGATTNQPWKMTFDDTHRTGGDAVTQLARGDYIEILLIYNPTKGEYRAYEVVHNN